MEKILTAIQSSQIREIYKHRYKVLLMHILYGMEIGENENYRKIPRRNREADKQKAMLRIADYANLRNGNDGARVDRST